eukprot:2867370-Rhodomonas_salina.1
MAETPRAILRRPSYFSTSLVLRCARVRRPVMNPRRMRSRADRSASRVARVSRRRVSAAARRVRNLGST